MSAPKKYYEVTSAVMMDDDGGDRGAIAAATAEMLGPLGLNRLLRGIAIHAHNQATHFERTEMDPEHQKYVEMLRAAGNALDLLGKQIGSFSQVKVVTT